MQRVEKMFDVRRKSVKTNKNYHKIKQVCSWKSVRGLCKLRQLFFLLFFCSRNLFLGTTLSFHFNVTIQCWKCFQRAFTWRYRFMEISQFNIAIRTFAFFAFFLSRLSLLPSKSTFRRWKFPWNIEIEFPLMASPSNCSPSSKPLVCESKHIVVVRALSGQTFLIISFVGFKSSFRSYLHF